MSTIQDDLDILRAAIERAGSQSALARALKLSAPTVVHHWCRKQRVPAWRVRELREYLAQPTESTPSAAA